MYRCGQLHKFFRFIVVMFFDGFKDVSKIIIAENAPRILKEIRENMKAQAFLGMRTEVRGRGRWIDVEEGGWRWREVEGSGG
jgi:hypothetical protein